MKAQNKMSPMMMHYLSVKKGYPDTILMYRLGDFYEMFFDDAREASKILDLTLTGRDCGLEERAPMCGVPYHAVENYIARLIKAGKKVAICEQLTAPGDQKGMVKRDVVRVLTAGTVTGDQMIAADDFNYLASYVSCGEKEGLAWLDLTTGECSVFKPGKVSASEKLLTLAPKEIIANEKGREFLIDSDAVQSGKLPKPGSHYEYAFSEENAEETLKKFFGVYSISALGLERGASVMALGGLIDYVTATQKQHLDHIETPKVIDDAEEMFIDFNTVRNLELTETLFDRTKNGSLLGVMDKTCTNMGARALKHSILHPFSKLSDIEKRLDAVQEIFDNPNYAADLREILKDIRDIERLRNKIAYNTINPRECRAILSSLEAIKALKTALKPFKSAKLTSIYEIIDPLEDLADTLSSVLSEDPPVSVSEGGVIREGYSEELDKLRSAKSSAKDWLSEYEAKERENTGIKQLKVGYNKVFGYYIEVSNGNLGLVPIRFQRKQTLTTGERFITEELKEMEEIILGSDEKALRIEQEIFDKLKARLKTALTALQMNAYATAECDLIQSLATLAKQNGYTRPKTDLSGEIVIKNGRHPVIESIKKRSEYIPNDVIMDKDSRILVITGPNMAGKSTYMRQAALIVLMAHMGSFVPAEKARIGLVDRIFTRVGAGDNLASGQSTFMVEMTEMASILNNATDKSLIVLDEVGRGTSTIDGLSIAWAIVEHLSLKLKAKTLFATHYHELAELESTLPSLKNYHVLVKESDGTVTFLYKIARGSANKSFGIEVAELAGIKKEITKRAAFVMQAIEDTSGAGLKKRISDRPGEDAVPSDEQIALFAEDSRLGKVEAVLKDVDVNSITPVQSLTILSELVSIVKPKRRKGSKA